MTSSFTRWRHNIGTFIARRGPMLLVTTASASALSIIMMSALQLFVEDVYFSGEYIIFVVVGSVSAGLLFATRLFREKPSAASLPLLLRLRAETMRNYSLSILFLIGVVLLFGFWIFAQATALTEREPRRHLDDAVATLEDIEDIHNAYNLELIRLRAIMQSLEANSPEDTIVSPGTEVLLARIQKSVDNADFFKSDAATLEGLYAGRITQAAALAQGPSSGGAIVTAISIRIGAIILILFAVQLLNTVYRYTLRLAAFYDSRADALELGQTDLTAFSSVVRDLTPDIEFGKNPVPPISEFANMVAAAMKQPNKD